MNKIQFALFGAVGMKNKEEKTEIKINKDENLGYGGGDDSLSYVSKDEKSEVSIINKKENQENQTSVGFKESFVNNLNFTEAGFGNIYFIFLVMFFFIIALFLKTYLKKAS